MKTHLAAAVLILFVGAALIIVGCSKESSVSKEGADKLAAKVGDWEMTRGELDDLIEQLPEAQKKKFNNPAGRAELTKRLIEQEVFYQEALSSGFEDDEKVRKQVEEFERSVVVNEYFEREIRPLAFPSEEEIHDYYEANEPSYTRAPIARAQHIFSTDSLKLVGYKAQIEAGEPMTTLAHLHSEDDLTRPDGGNLGYFNPGGYIRGIGYSKELSDAAFSMEMGVVSDPIKWTKGYSLLRVNELRPEEVRPFEDVREEIKGILTRKQLDRVQGEAFDVVKEKYDITNFISDSMMLTERTPEELWNLAQNTTDSYQRLRYYKQIVEEHPESKYGAEAQFMIGFVYAEEIKSIPDADKAFHAVINQYPNSEVAETAAWMLENLNQDLPEFEDLDDLHEKVKGESK